MSEYISREALLEKLKYMGDYNIDMDYVTVEDIMSILSEDIRDNRWIPVSERLPEDYDRVLITVNGCRGLIVREAQYYKARNEFEVLHNHERWEVGEKGLFAWQPLPEPYQKGGE